MELSLVPLHYNRAYLEACCVLLNDEWERSFTARMHSLESSSDNLPTNLILLQEKKLIGHVKLSCIPSTNDACFIESVVIEKELRGRGFGTILMEKAEGYCKSILNMKTIYLSTIDQQGFYRKLGYIECPPISIYGNFVPTTFKNGTNVRGKAPEGAPRPPPLPSLQKKPATKIFMKKEFN